jgi:hypothetical protein
MAEQGSSGSSPPASPAQQQQQQLPGSGPGPGPKDCLACRLTGTVVCLGASAYLAAHHYRQPPVSTGPAHRAAMLAAAGGFLALGIARALI